METFSLRSTVVFCIFQRRWPSDFGFPRRDHTESGWLKGHGWYESSLHYGVNGMGKTGRVKKKKNEVLVMKPHSFNNKAKANNE